MKVILAVDALSNTLTGIGRYTWELGRGLERSERIEALRFFSHAWFVPEMKAPPPGASSTAVKKRGAGRAVLRLGYRIMGPSLQRMALSRYSDWLFHSPNFYLPNCGCRTVVTIHDLSIFRYPECHPADRVRHLSKVIPDAARRASLILTDSDFIKREIEAAYPETKGRIVAVPLAAAEEFHQRSDAEIEGILAKHALTVRGYSLYLGTIEPRKNIMGLINSYAELPPRLRLKYPLILAGNPGWNSSAIHDRIKECEKEGWLRYLGYADEAELPALVAGARCFVFPSLYEGFGLPVLEAMASGVPVVTSPDSAMQDIAEDCALYACTGNSEELAERIEQLLMDDELHNSLSKSGILRAKSFSWDNTVKMTIEAYRQALA